MKSKIHILHGEGHLTEKRNLVLDNVKSNRTLVVLPDLKNYSLYEGFNRNIRVGLPYSSLKTSLLLEHADIIVEPYDGNDFRSFMKESALIEEFLRSENKNMYLIVDENVSMELSEKISRFDKKIQVFHEKGAKIYTVTNLSLKSL